MFIRISLLLMIAALPVFLLVELLLRLMVPVLPDMLTVLGSALLISSFTLLGMGFIFGLLKTMSRSLRNYFSLNQRLQRRFRFVQEQKDQFKRLFQQQTKQLTYINEFKRLRWSKRNDQKHLDSLSNTIKHELLSLKSKLPQKKYQQLQSEFIRSKQQQDIQALLNLQKNLSNLV